jgi:hypothetical protein
LARQFGWDSIQVSAGTIMEKEIWAHIFTRSRDIGGKCILSYVDCIVFNQRNTL